MLLKDYMICWYETYRMPRQQRNTAEATLSLIRTHIIPHVIGTKELKEVTTRDCQLFLTEMLLTGNRCPIPQIGTYGGPLSKWSVIKLRQLLSAMFEAAKREGEVCSNPVTGTDPLPVPETSTTPFTPEQQKAFLKYTRHHRFYAAYVLYFYTGCRRAEILGLSWDNVHMKENYILICQSLIIENSQPVLKKNHTKTKRSLRSIPIPKEIKYILGEVRQRQKQESKSIAGWSNPCNLVFTNRDGSMVNPAYFSRNFKNTLLRMGFPKDLHLHSIRHTWATNMLQCGIPISDVQALGGWSRPDVLLGIYAHSVQTSHKRAINKLWREMNKK